ncbi:MAG: hypothetical protein ABF449_10000 [Ethanoligenens sp.]
MFLLLGTLFPAAPVAAANAEKAVFNAGDGTADSPYTIADKAHLQAFRDSVNAGQTYAGQFIALSGDIDLSGTGWTPIDGFAGTLDGAEHVIRGLTIGSSETPADAATAGFFATLGATAKIENLGLTDVSIHTVNGNMAYAGGLAAKTASGSVAGGTVIDRCYVSGSTIRAETNTGKLSYAGGLIAFLGSYTTVSNSWTNVAVESKAGGTLSAYAGGLTAMASNFITVVNCYTLGDVTATSSNANMGAVVGGLFGMQSGKSYNCYSRSKVTAQNQNVITGAYQDTVYQLVGALAGQVASNGTMDTIYYGTDTSIMVNGTAKSVVPAVGQGASNTAPTHCVGYSGENMSSAAFVAVLNGGVQSESLSLPQGISLCKWMLKNGVASLENVSLPDSGGIDSRIFAGGAGTPDRPYLIKTEQQLRDFAMSLNATVDYSGVSIQLANDLDVSSADWTPVGQGEYAFRGVFDGGGHTITGLKYGRPDASKDATETVYIALFGVVGETGLIKNLGVTDVSIHTTSGSSIQSASIAGYLDHGGIDNCFATGAISSVGTQSNNNYVGGLVSYQAGGFVVNSWTNVTVRSETLGGMAAEAGGLVALNNRGLVANCYTLGNVSGSANRTTAEGATYLSNLVACQAGTMVNCYVLGNAASDCFTFYLGALSGMTTGIGKGYVSYYNTSASQTINGQTLAPLVAVGNTVRATENGSTNQGFNIGLAGYSSSDMRSSDFADTLNSTFATFPVDVSAWLPQGVTLKKWTYDATKNLVTPTGGSAELSYQPVDPPKETILYHPGTYLGRAVGKNDIIMRVTVTESKISSIQVVSSNEGTGYDPSALIAAVLKQQTIDSISYDSNDSSLSATLGAIDSALEKAKTGDTTGYGKVDAHIFAGGTGTEGDPYRISTAAQLTAFANSVNTDESYENTYVRLDADISLTGVDWVPTGSGNASHAFSGIFDGAGHIISGLTVGSAENAAAYQFSGLFGYLNHATVKNVSIQSAGINDNYTGDGRAYAGVLAGALENGTTIQNCTVQGTLSLQALNQCYVGGLSGYTSGVIGSISLAVNCAANVEVTGRSDTSWVYAGGLSGLNNRTNLVNSYALGNVTGDSGSNSNHVGAGGLVGFQAGYVRNCYSMGNVKSLPSSTENVGGYAGRQTGIASAYYAYYNTDASRYSGDTSLDATVGAGKYVVSSETGQVIAEHVEGKAQSFLKSAAFAALLNQNQSDDAVYGALPDGVALKSWVYDQDTNVVTFAPDTSDGDASNQNKSNVTNDSMPEQDAVGKESSKESNPQTGGSTLPLLPVGVTGVVSLVCILLIKRKIRP